MPSFLSICVFFAAYLATGCLLGVITGETALMHTPWFESGPGLRGILIGLGMMPEFFLIPHFASDGLENFPAVVPRPFRRFSPSTIAFGGAATVGCAQGLLTFLFWHFAAPPFAFDLLTVVSVTVTFVMVVGACLLLFMATRTAAVLSSAEQARLALKEKRARRRRRLSS